MNIRFLLTYSLAVTILALLSGISEGKAQDTLIACNSIATQTEEYDSDYSVTFADLIPIPSASPTSSKTISLLL